MPTTFATVLEFALGDTSFVIDINRQGDTFSLRGQAASGRIGGVDPVISLEPSDCAPTVPDRDGGFAFHDIPPGLVRLRAIDSHGRASTSPWVWL